MSGSSPPARFYDWIREDSKILSATSTDETVQHLPPYTDGMEKQALGQDQQDHICYFLDICRYKRAHQHDLGGTYFSDQDYKASRCTAVLVPSDADWRQLRDSLWSRVYAEHPALPRVARPSRILAEYVHKDSTKRDTVHWVNMDEEGGRVFCAVLKRKDVKILKLLIHMVA